MEKEVENKSLNKSAPVVETFSDDILKMAESGEAGVIRGIIKGEENKELEKINSSPTSKKNEILIALSILFILLAIGSIVGFYYLTNKKQTVEIAPKFKPLIYTESYKLLEIKNLTKDKVVESILGEIQNSKKEESAIKTYYFTENDKTISLERFLSIFEVNINNETILSFYPSFLLGTFQKEKSYVFILLKSDTTASVFDGMKLWENKMFFDLHDLFGIELNKDTNYLATKNFTDGIIENKNARILYDKEGHIVLAYVFLNNTSIALVDNIIPVKELLFRLSNDNNLKK